MAIAEQKTAHKNKMLWKRERRVTMVAGFTPIVGKNSYGGYPPVKSRASKSDNPSYRKSIWPAAKIAHRTLSARSGDK